MNILNKILIEWNNSDFNDSGIVKMSDVMNKIKYQLVYTLDKPRRIKIFDGHWPGCNKFKDKVYINYEHAELNENGFTVNEYEAGEYQVYIDGFDKLNETGFCTFDNCIDLTSATIPNSVKKIGWCTFRGCTGLISVTIPNSVIKIDDWAFGDCRSLTSVTIPSSVKLIGKWAFAYCKNLKTVYVENIDKFNEIQFINQFSYPTCHGAKLIELKK